MASLKHLAALAAEDHIQLRMDLRYLVNAAGARIGSQSETVAHIAAVHWRARHAPRLRAPEVRWLRVAALFHEMQGIRRPAMSRLGCDRKSEFAIWRIIDAFGAIWKLRNPAQTKGLAVALGPYLRVCLLFEVAHEAGLPPFFREMWRAGGLGPLPPLHAWRTACNGARRMRPYSRRAALGRSARKPVPLWRSS